MNKNLYYLRLNNILVELSGTSLGSILTSDDYMDKILLEKARRNPEATFNFYKGETLLFTGLLSSI